jgi:hypothetical protein
MSLTPGTPRRTGVRAALGSLSKLAVAASALVALESLVLIGLGVLQLVRGFGGDIDDPLRAEFGAVLGLFGGICLALAARALAAGRRWARSPILVAQLLSLPVAVALIQNDLVGYGVPLAVTAGAVIVLLIASGVYQPRDD